MIPRIRVVSGLAIDDNNHVLMGLRRPDVRCPSMWEFPGGKVERAEGDAAALIREWQEELKVTPTVGRRIARATLDVWTPITISLYHVRLNGQTPVVADHVELRWVDPAHAVEWMPCTPSTYAFNASVRPFLASLARGAVR